MNNPRPNPYIGPRAFKIGETLFGREREKNELYDLLIAERIVVLHSPSGAGKSSLVYAGLIPHLEEEGFHVLPVIRVNQERPLDLVKGDDTLSLLSQFNRYVFSTLLSIEEGLEPQERTDLVHLARASLDSYLDMIIQKAHSNDAGPATTSHVIIFDQFEEVLTLDSTDREAKLSFFQQLGLALRNRDVWALFVIREDYLAGLEPYTRPIPTRLSNTYRLDLLGVEAAHQAIEGPARSAQVSFTEDTADKLVDDLRRIQVQQPDGTMMEVPGPNIEPVQLQVVCYRLWQNLAADDAEIDANDLATIGDVNQSLAEYYASWVAEVAKDTAVSERAIRAWFEHQLITESGIRSQVLMQPGASSNLENKAIWKLVDAHLVRAENRRNVTWFELAHDRLVAPIRQNNAAWFDTNLSDLQRQAENWERSKRSDSLLVIGAALTAHLAWAEAHSGELNASEKEYLQASQEAEKLANEKIQQQEELKRLELERSKAEEKARNAARLRRLLIVAVFAAAAALVFAVFAFNQRSQAVQQRGLAQQNAATANAASTESAGNEAEAKGNLIVAQTQEAIAAAQKATAELARATATAALGTAVVDRQIASEKEAIALTAQAKEAIERARAETNAKLANSRQLAAESEGMLNSNPRLAGLLAVEAYRTSDTREGREAILANLQRDLGKSLETFGKPPGLQNTFIYTVAIHRDKPYIAWGDKDGTVTLWNYEQGKPIWSVRGKAGSEQAGHTDGVWGIDFSPDGKTLASGGLDSKVFLWDIASGQGRPIDLENREVYSLRFSPKGDQLAVAAEARVRIYDLLPTVAEHDLPNRISHSKFVNAVAWSPSGELLATSGEDGAVKVWQASNGALVQNFKIGGKAIGLDWSPDGSYLAAGNSLHDVVVWKTDLWNEVGRMVHDETPDNVDPTVIFDLAFIGNDLLATAGNDNRIILWDINTLTPREKRYLGKGQLRSLKARVNKRPNLLVSGGTDQQVRVFEVKTERPISESFRNMDDAVTGIWAASPDPLVTLVETSTGVTIHTDSASDELTIPGKFTSQAISPDGTLIALGGSDGSIQIIDRNNPKQHLPKIQAGRAAVQALAFSPAGNTLAASQCSRQAAQTKGPPVCQENQISFWNPTNGQPAGETIILPGGTITALVYHPDAPKLAAGISGGTGNLNEQPQPGDLGTSAGIEGSGIRLIDLGTSESILLPAVDQGNGITSLAFSPDGNILVSGGEDQTILLRDTYNLLPIGSPISLSQIPLSLTFEPNGQYFFSGGQDGTIERWEADPNLWINRVCAMTESDLTPEEILQFLPDRPTGYQACP